MNPVLTTISELKKEIKELKHDQSTVKHEDVRNDIKLRIARLEQRILFLRHSAENNNPPS